MSTLQTVDEIETESGPCVTCNALVTIRMRRDGGVILVDSRDYSGLTTDGDAFVCPDHYCPPCGGAHADAAQFDACAFSDSDDVDLTPPCSVDVADAILRRDGVRV